MSLSKDLLLMVLALVLGLVLGWKCSGCRHTRGNSTHTDTVVRRDTLRIYHTDTLPVRVPTLVKQTRVRIDTFEAPSEHPLYEGACDDYNFLREYEDPVNLLGGRIIIKNAVTQNRLVRQQVIVDSIPLTTITHTIIQQAPPRHNSVWAGWTAGYDPGSLTLYGGPTLTFEHKRGWAIEAGPMLSTRGRVGGQLSLKKKITFHKP